MLIILDRGIGTGYGFRGYVKSVKDFKFAVSHPFSLSMTRPTSQG